jgi:5-methylcytosine-specific restriction protein A
MPRAPRLCSYADCYELSETADRCGDHKRKDTRPSAARRGYDQAHRQFRTAVLTRDPVCVWPDCTSAATEADHYPLSRRELVARGMNPNDPQHGRGLCKSHHSHDTAQTYGYLGGKP